MSIRVRWENDPRPVEPRDLQRAKDLARADFAAVVKDVKADLKGPMADKQPIHALRFRRIGQELTAAPSWKMPMAGNLTMTDTGMTDEPAAAICCNSCRPSCMKTRRWSFAFGTIWIKEHSRSSR
jgi:hypothetical protein